MDDSIKRITALFGTIDHIVEASVLADAQLNVTVKTAARYALELELKTMLANKETVYTANDLILLLNISRSTYAEYVKKGMLNPRRICNKHFYLLSDLADGIENSKNKGFI